MEPEEIQDPDDNPIEALCFLCSEHGFFYMSTDTDIKKNVPCPECGVPMGFECVLP